MVAYITSTAGEDYRRASYEIWQAMAAAEPASGVGCGRPRVVSEEMLRALGPVPGQTILALAAGAGEGAWISMTTASMACRAAGATC